MLWRKVNRGVGERDEAPARGVEQQMSAYKSISRRLAIKAVKLHNLKNFSP